MTLPQAPQIGSTGLVQQPGIAQQLAPILEQITQRKLADAQIANYQSLTEERKAQAAALAREAQDAAEAAQAFYAHLSGSATRLKPEKPKDGVPANQGVDETSGMLMPLPQFERGLSPQSHALYVKMIADHNAAIQQGLEGTKTQVMTEHQRAQTDLSRVQATEATEAAGRALASRRILAGANLSTPNGQRKAIGAVLQEAGPDEAQKVAQALNVGSGRYGHLVGPDGFLYITDSKDGTVRRDTTVGQRGLPNQEAVRRGAQTIVDLLDEQTRIIQQYGIKGSRNPTPAQLAQTGRVLGISTEAVANMLRSDPQQLTQMLKTRFAHNYVGLLPHSRSAANLLENLTQSYWGPAGSSEDLLRRAEKDRQHLRAIMYGIVTGKITDLSRIPGFAAAAAAAVAEGQVPQGAGVGTSVVPNPDAWAGGVPPP